MNDVADNPANDRGLVAFNKFVAIGFIFTGILLLPWVFGKLFAFVRLIETEKSQLLLVSLTTAAFGLLIFLSHRKIGSYLAMFFFSCLFLVWIELLFRLVIQWLPGNSADNDLYMQSNWTYEENIAYEGSAFLHFTGKTAKTLSGNAALAGIMPYNNYGFPGGNIYRFKPANVIRVACLGESTTADGYPAFLQQYLNANNEGIPFRFEVYNFGHAYWTSAHSVSNFVLNIRDFQPDFIVIHHGWNEMKVRGYPDSLFRGDYGHAFKNFSAPYVYDRYLIRICSIYRYFKFKYDQSPFWTDLASSIQKLSPSSGIDFNNKKELEPFRRNIETIIRLSIIDSIRVVCATISHTSDTGAAMFYAAPSIDQCNSIVRELARKYGDAVILADLDSAMTGRMNSLFTDLAHVTDKGREVKAGLIGKPILDYLKQRPVYSHKRTVHFESDAVAYFKDLMLKDPAWMKDIREKAEKFNISIDSAMARDASYMLSSELDKPVNP
jgi:hypothetical protein